jgi:hypothetical protein
VKDELLHISSDHLNVVLDTSKLVSYFHKAFPGLLLSRFLLASSEIVAPADVHQELVLIFISDLH